MLLATVTLFWGCKEEKASQETVNVNENAERVEQVENVETDDGAFEAAPNVARTKAAPQKVKTTPAAKVSAKKPYALSIRKERSYFQAEKIVGHLKDMGVMAYVFERTEKGESWYHVAAGAFETKAEAQSFKSQLLSEWNIEADSLFSFVAMNKVDKGNLVVEKPSSGEKKRVSAQTPGVPDVVLQTVSKVPVANAFYIGKMGLLNFSQGNTGSIPGLRMSFNYPKGISLRYLMDRCAVFAEVMLVDNIYRENITFDVLRLKNGQSAASVMEDVAGRISGSSKNSADNKNPVSFETSGGRLIGYEVKVKNASNFILSDNTNPFVYVVRNSGKSTESLRRLVARIGRGSGLLDYDEFWNSFYLLPKNLKGDVFLSYSSERLNASYAKSKGNSEWSKRLVGHWAYNMYFYTPGKGVWAYTVFDMLTKSNSQKAWSVYGGSLDEKTNRHICGTTGHAVGDGFLEMNYPHDRYILILDSYKNNNFSESDFVSRAQNFQSTCGN